MSIRPEELFDLDKILLETHTKEKLFIIAGPEFDDFEEHILVTDNALDGTRVAGG